MLTFLLIGGLVWLALALVFVLALAAAARPQSAPSSVAEPVVMKAREVESVDDTVSAGDESLLPAESPVPT